RELAYLPKGVVEGHEVPHTAERAGKRPEEILDELEKN
ncbi:MAG: NAD(P)H-quinone oxidoreductase subunit I, partial [Okeania sp. SIO2H7]|nr:NAD(P)H-quinone oxidoreductase subunit I [Okeania sp. SIO2H7]